MPFWFHCFFLLGVARRLLLLLQYHCCCHPCCFSFFTTRFVNALVDVLLGNEIVFYLLRLHQASILALARTDCHMGQELDCQPYEFQRKPAKGFFATCTRIRYFLKASAAVSLASGFILGFQVSFWSRMLRRYRIGELYFMICRFPFGATSRADSKVRQRCSWPWRALKARAVIRFD